VSGTPAEKSEPLEVATNLGKLRFDLEPLPIRFLADASKLIDQQFLAFDEQIGCSVSIGRWQQPSVPAG
jgi:hypothetical protein